MSDNIINMMNSKATSIINKNNKAKVKIFDVEDKECGDILFMAKKLGLEICLARFYEDIEKYSVCIIASNDSNVKNRNKIFVNDKFPEMYKYFLLSYIIADFLLYGNNEEYAYVYNEYKEMDAETLRLANEIYNLQIEQKYETLKEKNKCKKLNK